MATLELSARYIYYSGTKLLPVEATIIGTKLFAFLLRLLGIGLAQFPTTHRLPESTRVFFEKPRPRREFANDYSHYTILFSRRSLLRIDRNEIRIGGSVSLSSVSLVIPILIGNRRNGERWTRDMQLGRFFEIRFVVYKIGSTISIFPPSFHSFLF